jgi:hypothetical protein
LTVVMVRACVLGRIGWCLMGQDDDKEKRKLLGMMGEDFKAREGQREQGSKEKGAG